MNGTAAILFRGRTFRTVSQEVIMEESRIVMSVKDLSRTLNVGINTAYQMVRQGEIRSVRVGRQYRIPAKAVEEYLGNQNMTM